MTILALTTTGSFDCGIAGECITSTNIGAMSLLATELAAPGVPSGAALGAQF